MSLGAAGGEGGGDADDERFARLGEVGDVDLVTRVLAEELDARDGVADLDLNLETASQRVDFNYQGGAAVATNLPWLRVWSGSIGNERRFVEAVYGRFAGG